MPLRDPDLWQRLQATPILLSDGGDLAVLLGQEFEIPPKAVAGIMTEYRRFLYLSAISDQAIAPSPAIAQVWRLHMADAAGWSDFSAEMFGRVLDGPSSRTRASPHPGYPPTLALLRQEFDMTPAKPVWPSQRDLDQSEGRASMLGILGVIAAIPIGWTFGMGIGFAVLALGLVVSAKGGFGDSSFSLLRRSSGSSD